MRRASTLKWLSASTSCAPTRSIPFASTFCGPLERLRNDSFGIRYSMSSDSVTGERRLPIGVRSRSSTGSSSGTS
jgi:hypothetical protein